jgi:hypothetical protein
MYITVNTAFDSLFTGVCISCRDRSGRCSPPTSSPRINLSLFPKHCAYTTTTMLSLLLSAELSGCVSYSTSCVQESRLTAAPESRTSAPPTPRRSHTTTPSRCSARRVARRIRTGSASTGLYVYAQLSSIMQTQQLSRLRNNTRSPEVGARRISCGSADCARCAPSSLSMWLLD